MISRPTTLLALLVAAILAGLIARPYLDRSLFVSAEPRPVAVRGDLPESERSTIEIFEHVSCRWCRWLPARACTNSDGSESRWKQDQGRGASGTGFIWDDQGHVVTNDHVVQGARSLRCACRRARSSAPNSSASRRITTLRCCASPVRGIFRRRLRSALRPISRSGRPRSRSAIPSASISRSPAASSAHSSAACRPCRSRDFQRHPDRRRHQSGQFRRAAAGFRGEGHRRHHGDHLAVRLERRYRLCRTGRHRQSHRAAIDQGRPRADAGHRHRRGE